MAEKGRSTLKYEEILGYANNLLSVIIKDPLPMMSDDVTMSPAKEIAHVEYDGMLYHVGFLFHKVGFYMDPNNNVYSLKEINVYCKITNKKEVLSGTLDDSLFLECDTTEELKAMLEKCVDDGGKLTQSPNNPVEFTYKNKEGLFSFMFLKVDDGYELIDVVTDKRNCKHNRYLKFFSDFNSGGFIGEILL